MQKQCLYGLLALGLFSLVSCKTHGPAFSANANPYMTKPVYQGENVGAVYLSGRMNRGYEYYTGEENKGGEAALHVAYAMEYFYICAGFFGYWGKYNVNPAVNPVSGGGEQGFNGGGFRGEIGGRLPLEHNFDVLIGISGEMFREGGPYAKNNEEVFADIFTFGLARNHLNLAPALDLRYSPYKSANIGMRYSLDSYFSVGDIFEDNQTNSYLHRLTLHGTVNPVTLYGQIGFTADQQRVYSLGMSYCIPFKKKEVKEE